MLLTAISQKLHWEDDVDEHVVNQNWPMPTTLGQKAAGHPSYISHFRRFHVNAINTQYFGMPQLSKRRGGKDIPTAWGPGGVRPEDVTKLDEMLKHANRKYCPYATK